MNYLRRGWRIFATGLAFLIFGVGALILGLLLGFYLVLAGFDPKKRIRVVRRTIMIICRIYLKSLKIMGLLTYAFHGFENLNANGKLVVANHPTLLDAIFLMAWIPNTTYVIKATMVRHFLIGGIARLAGYIPNDQGGVKLVEQAKLALLQGDALVIFPEGTRTTGTTPEFKRGAANIAIASDCVIVPIRIDCQPITLQKNQKWYHIPARIPHFSFRTLPEVTLKKGADISRPKSIQARQLTQYLQDYLTNSELTDKELALAVPKT